MRAQLLTVISRVRELVQRRRVEAEREEEFRVHLEMEIEHNRRAGMGEAEARRAALLAFGGVERFREQTREARGIVAVENIVRDTRFALRRLRRSPGFSLGVIATLAVGTGAAVAIGTLVYGVLLRPLPYAEPHRLVHISFITPGLDGGREHAHSEATFAHFRDAARSFSDIGAYHVNEGVNLTDQDDPARVTAVMITPGALTALRVVPELGRLFSAEDANVPVGGTIPVLISHALWRERYGADSAIVNRVIEVNRRARRVIGVLPPRFDFPAPHAAIYFPIEPQPERGALNSRYLTVIARLRPGADAASAAAELSSLIPRLTARHPEISTADIVRSGAHAAVVPLREAVVAAVRQHLQLLALTMLVVLMIAAANVTNLFLLRSERLRHEVAITTALGGGASALARRFIIEGIVLGTAAGIAALPLLIVALTSKFGFTHREIPRLHEIAPNGTTIALQVTVAVLLGAVIGALAFARVRRTQMDVGLRSSTRTVAGSGWRRLQQTLVAAQVTIALALVLSAALMARSLWNLNDADLGFTASGRASFAVTLPYSGYDTYEKTAAFHGRVLDRLRALPQADGAEAALEIPLVPEYPGELSFNITAPGEATRSERAAVNMVTPGYFELMRIPLLHGRSFMQGDARAATPGIVLSASLARALFGRTDVVGRLVRPPSPGDEDVYFRVVGIAGDVPRWKIEDGGVAMAYFPLLRDVDVVPQHSVPIPILMHIAHYVVRSDADIAQLAPLMRTAVRELDPRVPVTNIISLPAMVDAATARVRLTMLLLGAAAAAALLLGAIGIYSVVSYTVAGRLREFGVRIALGASPAAIRRTVMHDGMPVLTAGILLGIAAALAAARFARSLLYHVSPAEPAIYAATTALFVIVVGMATLLPARRAGRVDPVQIMRE